MVLMAARRHAGSPNRRLTEWLGGKDDSAVTQAVKRLEERMKTSSELKKIYQAVELKLSTVKT
jgi:hypothetical protein